MPFLTRQGFLAALCLALWTAGQPRSLAGADPPAQAPRHVLVKFKPAAGKDLLPLSNEQALEELLALLPLPAGARLEEPALSRWLRKQHPDRHPPGQTSPVDLERFLYLHLPPGLTVTGCLARLENHPWIDYVEPDGVGTGGQTIPNDPNFSVQWHHRNLSKIGADIHTPAAWDVTTGSSNVVVAVIDTGLNLSLSEFSGRLVPGFDFANGDADPTDDHGHGTAVAGVLCATGNNSTLGAGVDWQCRLMPIKALDLNNVGLFSWWAQAVDFAVNNGAKVINLSAGGSGSSTSLTRAITNAIARGAIFVTITHNDGTNVIRYPGNLSASITVGATDRTDRRADFSNYGPQIDLVAPGDGIYSVSRSGTLALWYGTSFAAPQVAGVCALLASLRPGLTQEEARSFLTAGAEDQLGDPTDTPGFDIYYGYGRLNASNSILLASTNMAEIALSQTVDPDPVSVDCDVTWTLLLTNLGPADATATFVTNFLPAGTLFSSAQTSQGSFMLDDPSQTVTFQVGALAAQTSARLSVTARPGAPGIFTNRAVAVVNEQELTTSNNQSIQSVSALIDQVGPVLVSTTVRADGRTIELAFSEALSVESATNPANYALRDGYINSLTISNIQPGARKSRVLLEAPLLTTVGPFTLTVGGLQDCLGLPMPGSTQTVLNIPPISLVPMGSTWKYLDDGSDQGTAWSTEAFDDVRWPVGPAQLGYGDGDEATLLQFGPSPDNKPVTAYFRRRFHVPNAAVLTNLTVHLLRDDGGAVYLNGVEVFLSNLPGTTLNYLTLASSTVGEPDETSFFTAPVGSSLLVSGTNLLAVEIHQASVNSSDLSFDLALTARMRDAVSSPAFLRQPESQTAVQGDNVSFQVEMAGTPPFGYQWWHGLAVIMPFERGGPTLTLTNVQLTNAGLYRVLVTNMANPTPGALSAPAELVVLADSDGDHMPDEWESQNGLSPNDPADGKQDKDGDGLLNREEYIAGTDPSDPGSYLRLERIQASPAGMLITFAALSNRTYSLLYHRLLPGGSWGTVSDFESHTTNRTVTVLDPAPPIPQRFYRLVTPKQP